MTAAHRPPVLGSLALIAVVIGLSAERSLIAFAGCLQATAEKLTKSTSTLQPLSALRGRLWSSAPDRGRR